ncbi:MAG: isoprenyl transferase [Bacteroidetes bacterium]|jgi:undecaprenyl diphosphate synthase|nr:isoprenyl transferase [Bacteroidota bacterium]
MNLKDQIDVAKLPQHVAVIMDGNGRWAQLKGKDRVFGHKNGVNAVKETLKAASELGIKALTLYAFSTENWNRPKTEVDTLMKLLASSLKRELKTLQKNNIKLNAIGNLESLPLTAQKELLEVIEKTSGNTDFILTLALSYGSREEIVKAIQNISKKVVNNELTIEEINENVINNHLYTFSLPEVDLIIRTSGEKRISNFLLWQIAYSEFYFTETLWPDFKKDDFYRAIIEYQKRERRFGKTSDQIK